MAATSEKPKHETIMVGKIKITSCPKFPEDQDMVLLPGGDYKICPYCGEKVEAE